jgi:Fe-S-cluster containining protein
VTPGPVEILREAVGAGLDPLLALARFRAVQDRFHADYAAADPVSCTRGCSACCSQMVFDVFPVEVEDLGRHLRREGLDAGILPRLRERRDRFDRLRLENPRRPGESDDDWVERIALAFWVEDDPCVFVDDDGACSIHAHRPQSCRRFFVHGPPQLCTPPTAASPERRARMVEPGTANEVDGLLAALGTRVAFDPEDDRLDHALVRWLELRSRD